MFEQLGDRLEGVFGRLRQRGVITAPMLQEGLREVRRALLEADVHYEVARDFLKRVEQRVLGERVLESIRPGDQLVKIVHDELIDVFGGAARSLEQATIPPTVVMLVGLQGSGKTTTAAKLALRLQREGRRPGLAALDPYRPAAAEQLAVLARSIDVPMFPEAVDGSTETAAPADGVPGRAVVAAAERAVDAARRQGITHLVLDMAGRLQADRELMDELTAVKTRVGPDEVLLVADGMTGQEAVRIAEGFHEAVGLSGVVLTKMDGDARGGAALSIHSVLGVPIKYIGVGEHMDDLTAFDPRRAAGRILQMGDVVGLVEKAQQTIDREASRRLEEKVLGDGRFDLEDFLQAIGQIQKMGPLEGLLKMIPGVKPKMLQNAQIDPQRVRHMEAIVRSMTPEERRRPEVLNGSRRARIARGSGRPVHEVNRLLKQFKEMRKMMKKMGGLAGLAGGGGLPPGAGLGSGLGSLLGR